MIYMSEQQRKMKDPEEHRNNQEDKHLEIETALETILEIHKSEIEGCQEGLIGLEKKSRNNSGAR